MKAIALRLLVSVSLLYYYQQKVYILKAIEFPSSFERGDQCTSSSMYPALSPSLQEDNNPSNTVSRITSTSHSLIPWQIDTRFTPTITPETFRIHRLHYFTLLWHFCCRACWFIDTLKVFEGKPHGKPATRSDNRVSLKRLVVL